MAAAARARPTDGGAGDARGDGGRARRRSTRCSRPAAAGFARMAAGTPTRTPGPRSRCGWSRPGSASAGTSRTRRPTRSRILQRVLHARRTGRGSTRSTSRRASPSARSSRLVPWVLHGVPATALRRRCSPTPGAAFKADLAAHPPPVRPPGGARPSGTLRLRRSEAVARPAGRATTARPAGSPTPRTAHGVVGVPGGELLLAGRGGGHREEGVDRARGGARAGRRSSSRRTARAGRRPRRRARRPPCRAPPRRRCTRSACENQSSVSRSSGWLA